MHENWTYLPDDADTDRLLEIAEYLDKHPTKLDMNYVFIGAHHRESPAGQLEGIPLDEWIHDCGTTACIQGWTELLYFTPKDRVLVGFTHCMKALRMDYDSYNAMCYPYGASPQGFNYLEVQDGHIAAEFLRRVVSTRRVDWSQVDDLIDAVVT